MGALAGLIGVCAAGDAFGGGLLGQAGALGVVPLKLGGGQVLHDLGLGHLGVVDVQLCTVVCQALRDSHSMTQRVESVTFCFRSRIAESGLVGAEALRNHAGRSIHIPSQRLISGCMQPVLRTHLSLIRTTAFLHLTDRDFLYDM